MIGKQEMVRYMRDHSGLTIAQASEAYDAVVAGIQEYLSQGEDVRLLGLCAFDVVDRPGRMARNLQTGEEVQVPPHKAIRVRISKPVKEAVKSIVM